MTTHPNSNNFHEHEDPNPISITNPPNPVVEDDTEDSSSSLLAASYVAEFASNFTIQSLFGGGDTDTLLPPLDDYEWMNAEDEDLYYQHNIGDDEYYFDGGDDQPLKMSPEELEKEFQRCLKLQQLENGEQKIEQHSSLKNEHIQNHRLSNRRASKLSLLKLPTEVILSILSHLGWKTKMDLFNCNKTLRELVQDKSLWRSLDCKGVPCTRHNVKVLESVIHRILLRDLFSGDNSLSEQEKEEMKKLLPGGALKHLNLGLFHLYLSTNVLCPVLEVSRESLETLSITGAIKVSDAELGSIIQWGKRLKTLNLPDCRILSDEILSEMGCELQNLEELDVSAIQGYNSITDVGVISLLKGLKEGQTSGFSKLTRLNLSGCHSLSDSSIMEIANSCENLERLDLIGCFEVTGRAINVIFRNQRNLSHLDVSFCWQVDDSIFEGLTSTEAGQSGPKTTSHLAIMSRLKTLILQGCSQITDKTLERLADCRPTKLHHLNVSYCSNLTDQVLSIVNDRIIPSCVVDETSIGGKKSKNTFQFYYEECVNITTALPNIQPF